MTAPSYGYLADAVLVAHFAFVVFVVCGGLLALRWRRMMWAHLPAAAWGVTIIIGGWICPLTPLENHLRQLGGESGYETGFIEHYITVLIYPETLTRPMQVGLGLAGFVFNACVYWMVWKRRPAAPSHVSSQT